MYMFMNLSDLAVNKSAVSNRFEMTKWRTVPYRTKDGNGKLLLSAQRANPEDVELELGLSGWYRIYIGLFSMHSVNYILLKLSNDDAYTPVRNAVKFQPKSWCSSEYMEEVCWKCADLTGQTLTLAKPLTDFPNAAGIAWIRCEELTDDEVTAYSEYSKKPNKCVQMHIDIDSFHEDRSAERVEQFSTLKLLQQSNADFCTFEYSMTYDQEHEDDYLPLLDSDQQLNTGKYTYDEIFKHSIQIAHSFGMKLYASERMSMANFSLPITKPQFRNHFITDHKDLYIRNRDGSCVNACSYAYESVQDYVIGQMIKMVSFGFDGVSMIFHRGVHIGFEKPVCELFANRYPGIDIRTLPASDARLHGVWCDIMTDFLRKAHMRLDKVSGKHIEINVITDYGLLTSKHFGLDVERWAKEGLVDAVSQADMETYEDLDGCLNSNGSIDLEKYRAKYEEQPVICRNYGTNPEKICQHISEYRQLEVKYGVRVYHILPWVNSRDINEYKAILKQMESAGARRYFAWNTNHVIWNLPEFHLITEIGNQADEKATQRRFVRTLSLDNNDISQFNANWRG